METDKKIIDIVNENYVYGYILYYLGIHFYNYSEKTLHQVCSELGLNENNVIKSLESANLDSTKDQLILKKYPVHLIIEYLIHAHYQFVKKRLPYLANLVSNLNNGAGEKGIIEDLKLVFPIFVEDFIQHIYQEEDTFFYHIKLLNKACHGSYNSAELYYHMERHSVKQFALDHHIHDDDMTAVTELLEQINQLPEDNLLLKVTVAELKNFERELDIHAKIENEILFPKALELEERVKSKINSTVRLN